MNADVTKYIAAALEDQRTLMQHVRALIHANVATVTGDAFGNPDCIRFSYATSEEILTEALRRIKEALAA